MTSILAHGGSAGLAAEIVLLSLPVLGFGLLWWWNRRLGRREAPGADPNGDQAGSAGQTREAGQSGLASQPGAAGQPGERADPSGGGPVAT